MRGAGVRHDHANSFFGNAECAGEFRPHAERALRPGPDREAAVLPFRHRRPRLERDVRDDTDAIRGLEHARRLRTRLRYVAGDDRTACPERRRGHGRRGRFGFL